MNSTIPQPDGLSVIEVDERPDVCLVRGCGGVVVRHSLGGGVAVHRCTRCFRRYQLRSVRERERSLLRRMFDEFVSWKDA
jgi:hypothetical protein